VGGLLLALTLGILVVGFLGTNWTTAHGAAASPATSSCSAHYHPWNFTASADCPVPGGQFCIDLSSISAGKYCFNTIDLNPADWLSWFGCQILASASAIWNAILGYLTLFLEALVNSVFSLITAGFNSVLQALLGAIQTLQDILLVFVNTLTSFLLGIADQAGPFAPVVLSVLVVAVVLIALAVTFLVWFGAIAIGKTIFNLL
jgi:hypothetical protein